MNNVLFRRGNQTFIDKNVPLNDGQIIFNETDEAIYVDTLLNGSVVRKRYGGGNLSRSDIDSALSDTSKNPVQNKVITESVLQKTDVVNDYNTAVAVTAIDIPVGCGVIKTANTKIGDLQTAVAQHTTDISMLNTAIANTSSRTVTALNNFTIRGNDYRCRETIFGFQFSATFIIPQLPSDRWYGVATSTSAFGNRYDDYIDAFVYDNGVWKKFDASVIGDGINININVFLSRDMSGKSLSFTFYAGRAGLR